MTGAAICPFSCWFYTSAVATWRTTARLVHSSLYRANHLRLRLLLQTPESRRRSSSRQERWARLCADPADPTFFAGLTGAFASAALARRLLQTSPAVEGSLHILLFLYAPMGNSRHPQSWGTCRISSRCLSYHFRTIDQPHCLGIVHCSHSPTVENIIYAASINMRFLPTAHLCAQAGQTPSLTRAVSGLVTPQAHAHNDIPSINAPCIHGHHGLDACDRVG